MSDFKTKLCLIIALTFCLICHFSEASAGLINKSGATIATRFEPPKHYKRVETGDNTFAHYLRNLPLYNHAAKVENDRGKNLKTGLRHVAFIDMDIDDKDLQQSADAIIRLRAEYLFAQKRFQDIHFRFTSGSKAQFTKFAEGYRPEISGNNFYWRKTESEDRSYDAFREYLALVFTYGGTFALDKSLTIVKPEQQLRIGDVAIEKKFPGRIMIIVDAAQHKKTGEMVYLLAYGSTDDRIIYVVNPISPFAKKPWFKLMQGEGVAAFGAKFKSAIFKRF